MAPANMKKPKALLFDIGGVCVISPMSAILDYERSQNIPIGWINYAISKSKPNGAWQQLERGDILMDQAFFAAFKRDLEHPFRWKEYLMMLAKRRAEKSDQKHQPISESDLPPPPTVDAEAMFWNMMRVSRQPDPYMAPALRKLKQSGQFILGALSNTVIFPPGHPFGMPSERPEEDVKAQFDVFVSSAHVGLRKPERPIYELAVRWLTEAYQAGTWGGGKQPGTLEPQDIVFLDDIGENLKMGKAVGIRTIKVPLNGTKDVVRQLEQLTGLSLLEDAAGTSKL